MALWWCVPVAVLFWVIGYAMAMVRGPFDAGFDNGYQQALDDMRENDRDAAG